MTVYISEYDLPASKPASFCRQDCCIMAAKDLHHSTLTWVLSQHSSMIGRTPFFFSSQVTDSVTFYFPQKNCSTKSFEQAINESSVRCQPALSDVTSQSLMTQQLHRRCELTEIRSGYVQSCDLARSISPFSFLNGRTVWIRKTWAHPSQGFQLASPERTVAFVTGKVACMFRSDCKSKKRTKESCKEVIKTEVSRL